MTDATKVLWHDVITHTEDGQLHRQSYGPEQVVPGSERIVDLLPTETVMIRRVQPANYLEPGFYWTRFKSTKAISLAEWSGVKWFYFGVSGADDFDALDVLSDRLRPPVA